MQLLHASGCPKQFIAVYCVNLFMISHTTSLLYCALFDTAVGKKKNVNVGSKGGSAGLDDYKFDTPLDDADDFM